MAASDSPRPGWIDPEQYPFDSNHADLDAGRLHYVDEGEGRPVLMLHGNPTWSFLYRHLIRELSEGYRCIAPDYLGFGLSEKPRDFSYRPAAHADVVEEFIEELGLAELTLVVHDWGGPIGCRYAVENPGNVHSLVVMNTFCWPVERDLYLKAFGGLLGSRLGKLLITRRNFFADTVMQLAFSERSRLTPEIHRHYLEPLSTPRERIPSWVFPRELLGSTEWVADVWERREALADTPALLCWGLDDPAFGREELRTWQALFPDARTVGFEDGGHYVQDEKGREMAPEIGQFLDETG